MISSYKKVKFGKYEIFEGEEPKKLHIKTDLIWRIIDETEDKFLLLSDFCISWYPYNAYWSLFMDAEECYWKDSYIRNERFKNLYEEAFSYEEKEAIVESTREVTINKVFKTKDDKKSKDYLFILSVEEIENYLKDDKAANVLLVYDIEHSDKLEFSFEESTWWTRTPGETLMENCIVTTNGKIDYNGYENTLDEVGIRPAMWVKKNFFENCL